MTMHVAERRGSPHVALLLAIVLGVALVATWSNDQTAPAPSDCAPAAAGGQADANEPRHDADRQDHRRLETGRGARAADERRSAAGALPRA